MTGDPLVSIIVPSYNTPERYMREAIASALDQTYRNVEVIIVDDGSTPESAAFLDVIAAGDARVRVIHQRNQGLSAARNTGIAAARGAYINFLDADDILLPDKLRLQVDALEAHPDIDFVYSDYAKLEEAEGKEYAAVRGIPPVPFPELLVYRNWFSPIVPLVRRRLVDRVGPFDVAFRASEDWDYWYRCTRFTEFLYVPGKVAMYRVHGSQMTKDLERMWTSNMQFADKHFSRDRARYRAHQTAYHLARAKHCRSRGDYWGCALHLAKYVTSARSLAEARMVWNFPKN